MGKHFELTEPDPDLVAILAAYKDTDGYTISPEMGAALDAATTKVDALLAYNEGFKAAIDSYLNTSIATLTGKSHD